MKCIAILTSYNDKKRRYLLYIRLHFHKFLNRQYTKDYSKINTPRTSDMLPYAKYIYNLVEVFVAQLNFTGVGCRLQTCSRFTSKWFDSTCWAYLLQFYTLIKLVIQIFFFFFYHIVVSLCKICFLIKMYYFITR